MKNTSTRTHYGDKDGLLVLSYGAIISAVLSNRNYGKTWAMQRRAFRRALKHGKKTLWLRMFKKEVKETSAKMYKSRDLQEYCGVSFYDEKTNPNGNMKQVGNRFFYRKKINGKWTRWTWFLQLYALSDADAVRSADDVDVDTIVFDEFTKTPDRYRRYRGNMVTDFIDILFSSKREHQVRCIMLGNKESVSNPFFNYFGIKPLPHTFEGIRTYRGASFAVQQINNVSEAESEYDKKVEALLHGTEYGNYIYSSMAKGQTGLKPRKTPASASLYCQLYINGVAIKISFLNGLFYVNRRIDTTQLIYCDALPNRWKRERLLVKRHKRFFDAFVMALADNRVYYDGEATHEAIEPFKQWLGV